MEHGSERKREKTKKTPRTHLPVQPPPAAARSPPQPRRRALPSRRIPARTRTKNRVSASPAVPRRRTKAKGAGPPTWSGGAPDPAGSAAAPGPAGSIGEPAARRGGRGRDLGGGRRLGFGSGGGGLEERGERGKGEGGRDAKLRAVLKWRGGGVVGLASRGDLWRLCGV